MTPKSRFFKHTHPCMLFLRATQMFYAVGGSQMADPGEIHLIHQNRRFYPAYNHIKSDLGSWNNSSAIVWDKDYTLHTRFYFLVYMHIILILKYAYNPSLNSNIEDKCSMSQIPVQRALMSNIQLYCKYLNRQESLRIKSII